MNKIGWILLITSLISSFCMNVTNNPMIVCLCMVVSFTSLYCVINWGLKND